MQRQTRELSEANAELQREVAHRKRAEEALQQTLRRARAAGRARAPRSCRAPTGSSASRSRSGGGSRRSAPSCSIREQQANRLKDEFLATVSHELRTPLNAVLGWARVLRSADVDPELQARALETIERNAQAQAQLIDDILDVSRIVTGKLRLKVRPLDLAQVIDAALDVVRPAADAKDITLESRYPAAAVARRLGDPDRLQQVVWNLLSNAVKFTPRGGTVDVRARRAPTAPDEIIVQRHRARASSPTFLPHVFDRSARPTLDDPRARRARARARHRAAARRAARRHGAAPRARASDRGARFIVAAARAADGARGCPGFGPAPRRARPTDRPTSPGSRVMVVDDDRDARELLTATLGYYGADVTAAESAAEALALLPEVRPDVLLSDIGMSGEDGYSFIRRVRALPRGPRRPHPGRRDHRLRDGRRSCAGDELRFPAARAEAVRSRSTSRARCSG